MPPGGCFDGSVNKKVQDRRKMCHMSRVDILFVVYGICFVVSLKWSSSDCKCQ